MNTVTYEQYYEEKTAFFAKHNNGFKLETSSLSVGNSYVKTYAFEDGAGWCELLRNVHEEAEFEHRGMTFKCTVSLAKLEFWSTDNSKSRYYYEKW